MKNCWYLNPLSLTLLIISLLFTASCAREYRPPANQEGGQDQTGELQEIQLDYNRGQVYILGDTAEIAPMVLDKLGDTSLECKSSVELPGWAVLDASTCQLSIRARHIGHWDFLIALGNAEKSVTSSISFSVEPPSPGSLPSASNPLMSGKYYMLTALASDSEYAVTFEPDKIRFLDFRNPDTPNLLATLAVPGAYGMPQAQASIGDYIFVVTTGGHVLSYDWSNRAAPAFLTALKVSNGGQNFDVATSINDWYQLFWC